jgi:hypothetical protein
MRRIDTAQRLATAARHAQHQGDHRKAAELFAEALKVLAQEERALTDERVSASRGEIAPSAQLPQRWRADGMPEPSGKSAGVRRAARRRAEH